MIRPLLLFLSLSLPLLALSDETIARSLVQVRVTKVFYQQARPWFKDQAEPYTITGLVLPGERILVLARDIRSAQILEVTKFSSYDRALATVVMEDINANLALLSVADKRFWQDLKPLELATTNAIPLSRVIAVKIDDAFRVYREEARIMEVIPAADYGFAFLPVAVFRTSEPILSGVLFKEDLLVGFIGYADRDKKAEAIGVETIRAFLARQGPSYPGFVAQGLSLEPLTDPVLRSYYKLPAQRSGALVVRTLPHSSAHGVLQKQDILLSVDGVALDNRGFYLDPGIGRQPALMLFALKGGQLRAPGETIPVVVWRNGKEQTLQMKLRSYSGQAERIPWHVADQPEYLIENGLVFLELTIPYIREVLGANWQSSPHHFNFLVREKRFYEDQEKDRPVILGSVLPDESNRSYENYAGTIVVELEGQSVSDLFAFKERLDHLAGQGKELASVTLAGGQKAIISLKDRPRINDRILKRYGIDKPFHLKPRPGR